jgi:hypothetical protein
MTSEDLMSCECVNLDWSEVDQTAEHHPLCAVEIEKGMTGLAAYCLAASGWTPDQPEHYYASLLVTMEDGSQQQLGVVFQSSSKPKTCDTQITRGKKPLPFKPSEITYSDAQGFVDVSHRVASGTFSARATSAPEGFIQVYLKRPSLRATQPSQEYAVWIDKADLQRLKADGYCLLRADDGKIYIP